MKTMRFGTEVIKPYFHIGYVDQDNRWVVSATADSMDEAKERLKDAIGDATDYISNYRYVERTVWDYTPKAPNRKEG